MCFVTTQIRNKINLNEPINPKPKLFIKSLTHICQQVRKGIENNIDAGFWVVAILFTKCVWSDFFMLV